MEGRPGADAGGKKTSKNSKERIKGEEERCKWVTADKKGKKKLKKKKREKNAVLEFEWVVRIKQKSKGQDLLFSLFLKGQVDRSLKLIPNWA